MGTEKCQPAIDTKEQSFPTVREGLLSDIESQNLTVKLEMAEELEKIGLSPIAILRILMSSELEKKGLSPETVLRLMDVNEEEKV